MTVTCRVKIITIDGPASSGKGTIARKVAEQLGFHYLDSGTIYRALALMVSRNVIPCSDTVSSLNKETISFSNVEIPAIVKLIDKMHLVFVENKIILNNQDETKTLRSEKIGIMASAVAKIPEVRARLLDFQRSFASEPGLVTDGRDMGSVVFPHADLKVFLTATAEKRALRRYSQLQENHGSGTIEAILRDITARDKQDCERSVAPLAYDSTYKVLDNSNMSVEETVQTVINWYKNIR